MLIMTQTEGILNLDHIVQIDTEEIGGRCNVYARTTIDQRVPYRSIRIATCESKEQGQYIIEHILAVYGESAKIMDIRQVVEVDLGLL